MSRNYQCARPGCKNLTPHARMRFCSEECSRQFFRDQRRSLMTTECPKCNHVFIAGEKKRGRRPKENQHATA